MKASTFSEQVGNSEPHLRSAILKLTWPASIEQAVITSILFADIIFLSRLGSEVIAGVGIAATLIFVFMALFNSVAVASTTVVAQAKGAGRPDLVRQGAAQSVTLAVVFGLVSGGLGALLAGIAMTLMGATGAVKDHGVVYMVPVLLSSPVYAVALAGGGVLKGVGDTRTPMLFTLAGNAVKILLSGLLIFGRWGMPALGVRGAALATVFGYSLTAVLTATKLRRGFDGMELRPDAFKTNLRLLRQVLALSLPVAGEQVAMRMGFVFYMRMVSALGTLALAANQIALRLESVALTLGFGYTVAATTLVGQAVGRGDLASAERRVRATGTLSVVTMGLTTLLLIAVRHWAVGLFAPEAAVSNLAAACVILGALEMPALGYIFTFAGGLRGAGDTRSPMLVAILGTFVFRLPLVYALGFGFDLGLQGIWWGTLLDWILRATVIYLVFRRGSWKTKAVITQAAEAKACIDERDVCEK